jgi:hypothetical protein
MKPFLMSVAAVVVGVSAYNLVKRFLPVLP